MITKLEEAVSDAGGYWVYFDDRPNYHWFEGMPKSPQSMTVGQQVKEYLKSGDAVSKKDVADQMKKQNDQALENFKQQQAERKEKREAKQVKEYEALIKRISQEITK